MQKERFRGLTLKAFFFFCKIYVLQNRKEPKMELNELHFFTAPKNQLIRQFLALPALPFPLYFSLTPYDL